MITKKETLELNRKQAEFYTSGLRPKLNVFSAAWRALRNGLLASFRQQYQIKEKLLEQHRTWLGDLSGKKVLDLGCLEGNSLSLYMAEHAEEYIGIDLSQSAISKLNQKLDSLDRPKARAIPVDFLSDDFKERDFDIIYAFAVMHHFENLDLLLDALITRLKPGGIVISYDPLETSFPVMLVRKLYRPFQNDKEWEWPFTRSTLKRIAAAMVVRDVKGILGRSKYGLALNMLPLPVSFKETAIRRWVDRDWDSHQIEDVYGCMQVTMRLEKSSSPNTIQSGSYQ